jgi:hypothetical protein
VMSGFYCTGLKKGPLADYEIIRPKRNEVGNLQYDATKSRIAKWYSAGLRAGSSGFESGRSWDFFSLPPYPDRLWVPSSLLYNGYQCLFPWE